VTPRAPIPAGLSGILNEGDPVAPRPAATVLLIDGRERPWRLLMMRRPSGADFAPGAYVFPGGSVHPEDAELGDPCRAAAVRELFEEMGILLARRPDGRFARDRECVRLRDRLGDGAGWTAALRDLELAPALDRLVFLARWITPEAIRRRFDTRFYVARRPPGQTVHPEPGEVADWRWIAPAEAMAEGGPTLVHATRRVLESVAGEADPSRLIARLRRLPESPPVLARLVRRPDGGLEVLDDAPL
jgi:8-oxo-dGTP pyrophosphatase MutT (NUDIX family)